MDQPTRNKFEQYCALAEIEDDSDRFSDVLKSIVRILEDKQSLLQRLKSERELRLPLNRSDVA